MKRQLLSDIVIGLLLAIIGMGGYFFLSPTKDLIQQCDKIIILANDNEYCVGVADTHKVRVKGLSWRESLDKGTGLLFVFNVMGDYGIWMKDMQFPIDILWMDNSLSIVHIAENVIPESYPKTYRSKTPAQYVLEINAGEVAKKNISVGSIVTIK